MTNREKATWRDPALGEARELDLAQGRLRCRRAAGRPSYSSTDCS